MQQVFSSLFDGYSYVHTAAF